MAVTLKLEENPLRFSSSELKTLNGYVITQGEVAAILREMNKLLAEAVTKDWLEAILNAFGLSVQGAIEQWIKAIIGGSLGARVVKILLGFSGVLKKLVLAAFRLVWTAISQELIKQQINGVCHAAWETVEERILPH